MRKKPDLGKAEEILLNQKYEARSLTLDAIREAHRTEQQTIITLAAGAFTVSVALLRFEQGWPGWRWFLLLSWIFLILSVLATLRSQFWGRKALETQLEREDADIEEKQAKMDAAQTMWVCRSRTTERWNQYAVYFFVAGLVLYVVYLGGAVLTDNKDAKETPHASTQESTSQACGETRAKEGGCQSSKGSCEEVSSQACGEVCRETGSEACSKAISEACGENVGQGCSEGRHQNNRCKGGGESCKTGSSEGRCKGL